MIHTKEPWAVDPDERPGMAWNNHIISADNPNMTICFMAHDNTADNIAGEANARRIVACVNACAGIPTDDLEACPDRGLFYLASHADQLVKQRDDLLAALQSISNITGDAGFNIGWPLEFCPGELPEDETNRLLSLACEYLKDISKEASRAIARVKADQFRDATKKTDDTSAPSIVFYPAGSLGEAVDSEGGAA